MNTGKQKTKPAKLLSLDRISLMLFVFSIVLGIFIYGFGVGYYRIFPFALIQVAKDAFDQIEEKEAHYPHVSFEQKETVRHLEGAYPGINLVTALVGDDQISARIIDMDGNTIHEWITDWFELWPDNTDHVRGKELPKTRPGTQIHGAVIMDNGDLVFNFSNLGVVRLSVEGEVLWRLPYQTHHSIYLREDGNLWIAGTIIREQADPDYPSYVPPFHEYMVLEVSGEGEILQEISVFELFKENNLQGFLYMGSAGNTSTSTGGDTLHMNDVECFPSTLASDFFEPGDIMVSMRDINTVLVFQEDTHKVKYLCTGMFVRQHDPDFVDGRTISVFDNNNVGHPEDGPQSRIVTIDAVTNELTVAFEGSEKVPFYSRYMGMHQWLPNGNVLITESTRGRALEITPEGEVVWEFINYVEPDRVGVVSEVTRLPASYAELYPSASSSEAPSASD